MKVLIYGAPENADKEKIKRMKSYFNCRLFVEDWNPDQAVRKKTLHVTGEYPTAGRRRAFGVALSYSQACREVGIDNNPTGMSGKPALEQLDLGLPECKNATFL